MSSLLAVFFDKSASRVDARVLLLLAQSKLKLLITIGTANMRVNNIMAVNQERISAYVFGVAWLMTMHSLYGRNQQHA